MTKLWFAPCAFVCIYLTHSNCKSECFIKANKSESDKAQMIHTLIGQLKSANRDPNPDSSHRITRFPDDYDFEAQRIVEDSKQKLIGMGRIVIPILVNHLEDKEYSYSDGRGSIFARSCSVGDVCFEIIAKLVDPGTTGNYKSRLGKDGKQHNYVPYLFQIQNEGKTSKQTAMRAWWKSHQDLSLNEIQIEVLKWYIDRERCIGFPESKDEEFYLMPLVNKLRSITKADR
jgi:hypothetical protein